ncbi:ATP-dependent RNA helicase HrpA [Acidobacteriota bacterium]
MGMPRMLRTPSTWLSDSWQTDRFEADLHNLLNINFSKIVSRNPPKTPPFPIKLQQLMRNAMLRDLHIVQHQLDSLNKQSPSHISRNRITRIINSCENRLRQSGKEREIRAQQRPKLSFPKELPISSRVGEIVGLIKKHQVVIISGETGCGKSTQIPKMCLKAGLGIYGKIACTQPRRIAATTIARRIAEELGETLGRAVGYKIRFQDESSQDTYVKILTDGMLLAETQGDPYLYEYDSIIIDEAHERSLNIDFLLGITKMLLKKRPELKLIITSATLDTEKFTHAFSNAPVIEVGGRMFPVEIEYHPDKGKSEGKVEDGDYVEQAVKAVEYIRKRKSPGDILIFMPTEHDILETCYKLEGRKYASTTILPLYARLPGTQQGQVYSVTGSKIVVATNVAETSLTIPGIKYVIDTGLARISQYQPGTRTNSLPINPISKSSADQRKGRCGRVQEGLCIRLYSQEDYETRLSFTPPEILRSNLAEVILRMTALKLEHPSTFPFVDRPKPKNIKDGFDLLLELGALEKRGRELSLTDRGRLMARMPLDPCISRMLLEAHKEGNLHEVSIIASALSIRDPRERPPEKETQADTKHAPFLHPDSDFLTLLNIWERFHGDWKKLSSQSKKRKFCREHFLSFPRMREWTYLNEQIKSILKDLKIPMGKKLESPLSKTAYAGVHHAILSGYLSNIAVLKEKNMYMSSRGREAMIFPGSTLFNKGNTWIVAAEMVRTSRLFARMAARIDPKWLEPIGGRLCKYSYSEPHWDKKRGEVVAKERVTLYGLEIVSDRRVSYGRINADEANQIFIQSALLEGNVLHKPEFLKRNLAFIERLSVMEDKLRRRDILANEEALVRFYSEKLKGITNIRSLEKRLKDQGGDNSLRMNEADILKNRPDPDELSEYPDEYRVGDMPFRTSYSFSPGEEKDGVTLKVPSRLLSSLSAGSLEWTVPGLFKEKITALIKGLPKRYRKQLVPIAEKADLILKDLELGTDSLFQTLSTLIRKRFGVNIPAREWAQVEIPIHLKMRIAAIDQKGRELRSGRDLDALILEIAESPSKEDSIVWKRAREKWERQGVLTWDFEKIPDKIPIGALTDAYLGLEPDKDGVNLRLFTRKEDSLRSHKLGVQLLLLKKYAKDLDYMRRYLGFPEEFDRVVLFFGGKQAVENGLLENLKKEIFQIDLRSREDYDAYEGTINRALLEKGHFLTETAQRIFKAYLKTRNSLAKTGKTCAGIKAVAELTEKIKGQTAELVPKDFLEIYTLDRLIHLPRYLESMEIRLERGKNSPEKDAQKAAQVETFSTALKRLQGTIDKDTPLEEIRKIEEFRWKIEEFKVSQFSPELKTPVPISAKRLLKYIKS